MRKTIVFVTHDIDEAIKMGDRIAVLRQDGRLAQYATPAELLANPADEFVADFVGSDRALKRLGLVTLAEVDLAAIGSRPTGDEVLSLRATVRDALAAVLAAGGAPLTVVDERGDVVGLATLEQIGGLFAGEAAAPTNHARRGRRSEASG